MKQAVPSHYRPRVTDRLTRGSSDWAKARVGGEGCHHALTVPGSRQDALAETGSQGSPWPTRSYTALRSGSLQCPISRRRNLGPREKDGPVDHKGGTDAAVLVQQDRVRPLLSRALLCTRRQYGLRHVVHIDRGAVVVARSPSRMFTFLNRGWARAPERRPRDRPVPQAAHSDRGDAYACSQSASRTTTCCLRHRREASSQAIHAGSRLRLGDLDAYGISKDHCGDLHADVNSQNVM